jgi:hypothetical protein
LFTAEKYHLRDGFYKFWECYWTKAGYLQMQYFRADHCSSLGVLDGGIYLWQTHCINIRCFTRCRNCLDPYLSMLVTAASWHPSFQSEA